MPFLFFMYFTDLSVHFGTIAPSIKIGTFAKEHAEALSSEIISHSLFFLATMQDFDFGTTIGIL